ncbi:SDR family NAD(P)-dependent oxidoreductase [Escherichia coli]
MLTCTSENCQQLAQRIAVNYPRLDGVLHNAGLLGDVCPMSEQNPQVWRDVMQVNVNATFMLTGHCFLYYSNRTPVHWSLLHQALDVRGRANWGAYAASKFATEGMMQVLADEYQQRLRVNCINRAVRAPQCVPAPSRPKIHRNLKHPLISCRSTSG